MSERLGTEFRRAMRRLASTVSVITTVAEGTRRGITATSVSSLSMDPATLVVCINSASSMIASLEKSQSFCVNLLRRGQQDVAASFAGQRAAEDRFAVGDWRAGFGGLPYLADAQANVFCEVRLAVPYATHVLFCGHVVDVEVLETVAPLIYQDGSYAALPAIA